MFKQLQWIIQQREAVIILAGIGASSLLTISILPNTLLLSKFQQQVQYRDKDGNEVPLDEDANKLIEKVLNRVQLESRAEVNLEFFTTTLGDPTYFGSLQTVCTAYVGLPASFMYKRRSDVDDITLGGSELNLPPVAAALFIDNLFLSEKAKAFAIARQLFYVSSFTTHVDASMKTIALMATMFSCSFLSHLLQLKNRMKPWGRISLYAVVAGLFYGMHLMGLDFYNVMLDRKVDRKAASLTRAYAEGGVEFYTKKLARNKILHDNASTGSRIYTAGGNDQFGFVRQKHATTSTRLKIVNQILDKFNADSEIRKDNDQKAVVAAKQPES